MACRAVGLQHLGVHAKGNMGKDLVPDLNVCDADKLLVYLLIVLSAVCTGATSSFKRARFLHV